MGSKRSSKNPTTTHSSPPTSPLNPQNPKNPNPPSLLSPSNSHKKPKLTSPSPSPSLSLSISPPPSAPPRWSDSHTLKLLNTILSLRAKTNFSPTPTNLPFLLSEIKHWLPSHLSQKNIHSKLRHLRFKFQKSPKPGPESSDFDRDFHDLASKLWAPKSPRKDERDSEHEAAEKDEPLVEEYKYLRLALEEYWRESKLNVGTLDAAFARVDPEKAKGLDEKFREVFLGMLKLKMDKNKVSNEIIHASLGC